MHPRSRHRLHRPHADRQGLSRRVQRDARRRPSPPTRSGPRSSGRRIDPAEVDDVIMGAALQQGVQTTIGRTAALRAGLPVTVAGMSIDRQCASGLMAIATAAKQIIVDRMDVCVAGGVESDLAWCRRRRCGSAPDPELLVDAQRRLHADDQHRRGGRQALQRQPRAPGRICAPLAAAHRRRPGRRQVRRRDRPGHRQDGGQGQGDRRDLDAGGHARQGRGQPARRRRSRTCRSSSR